MSLIDQTALQNCFDSLWGILSARQECTPDDLSFRNGVIHREEGFKERLIDDAKGIRDKYFSSALATPDENSIVEMVQELMDLLTPRRGQPQFVDHRDTTQFLLQLDGRYSSDIKKALYLLYVENSDKEAFALLSHALKKKYAVITYLFFLKDSEKYQVVRPNNFADRLPLIGASKRCVLECSWDQYQVFLSILQEVRDFLSARMNKEVTLTDAHSFVWMLWMLPNGPAAN